MLLLRDLLLSSSEIHIFDSFEKFVRDSDSSDNSYPISGKLLVFTWAMVIFITASLFVLGNAYLYPDTSIILTLSITIVITCSVVFRNDIQGAWILSFITWLILDIVLNALSVITTHILLPSSISSSIVAAKNKLKVSHYSNTLYNHQQYHHHHQQYHHHHHHR